MMWWCVHPHVNILVDAPVWCTIIWRQNIDRWRCNGPQEPLQRYQGQVIGQCHCWMRWRQRIGWLVDHTGVECHRHGSSVVKRPVKIFCSSRSRGSSPGGKNWGIAGVGIDEGGCGFVRMDRTYWKCCIIRTTVARVVESCIMESLWDGTRKA